MAKLEKMMSDSTTSAATPNADESTNAFGLTKTDIHALAWQAELDHGTVVGGPSATEIAVQLTINKAEQNSRASAEKLLRIIAYTYQVAGAHDAPDRILDVLADPEEATDEQVEAMLPYQPSDRLSLLRKPISATNPLPPGCFCKPGQCGAPRPNWCRDHAKRDAAAESN